MRDDIIEIIQRDVKEKCENPNNFFGSGIYYHIKAVVKNAVLLAEEYGCDAEVVEIAAWLHDYASVLDYQYYEDHHIYGARMAGEMLEGYGYPEEKRKLVQQCILNHRGSVVREKCTVEEVCVADGDAISHFDSIPSLFYLAYVNRGYSIQEGIDFVERKLCRSFDKLSEKSRSLYQEKFLNAIKVVRGK